MKSAPTILLILAGILAFLAGYVVMTKDATQHATSVATSTPPLATSTEEQWVTLTNTKYGYSVQYAVSGLEVLVDGHDFGEQVVTNTKGGSVSIVRFGTGDVGTFNLRVINAEILQENPNLTQDRTIIADYTLDLPTYVRRIREDTILQGNSAEYITEATPITEIEVSGIKGYTYTSSSTYIGTESYEYASKGNFHRYLFFEHRGNKVHINFLENNPISHKILSTFRFE
jgi:hypothetical protein